MTHQDDKQSALASFEAENAEPTPPVPARWYCMANNGLATLCANEQDARIMAEECDLSWPKNAPHRAVLLGDVAAERERCAMICDRAAEMAWSRWDLLSMQFDQGGAFEAEKIADEIRKVQALEQRRAA